MRTHIQKASESSLKGCWGKGDRARIEGVIEEQTRCVYQATDRHKDKQDDRKLCWGCRWGTERQVRLWGLRDHRKEENNQGKEEPGPESINTHTQRNTHI